MITSTCCTPALGALSDAGTAFDGKHLFQLGQGQINRLDPDTGAVLNSIPAPPNASGLAWAEGVLWVGSYRTREIRQIDPETGAVLRTLTSNRFVTGVTWVNGELWHGARHEEESELRQIDPTTGQVLRRLIMPKGMTISGLESNGSNEFYCGGGTSGTVRVVRRSEQRRDKT